MKGESPAMVRAIAMRRASRRILSSATLVVQRIDMATRTFLCI